MTTTRVLITGANGLIGRILRERLPHDFILHGLDREPGPDRSVLTADIAEPEQLEHAFRQLPALQGIVHLAADSRVDAPWASVLRNNIVGTRMVYEMARRFNVPQIVFASSNHVMGAREFRNELPTVPIGVTAPVAPDGDYGVSKVFGETVARYFADRYGIRSICLRIGSVLPDDRPFAQARWRRLWLSHRDLVQLIALSLRSNLEFGVFYGISANRDSPYDITETRRLLGYRPQDDAALLPASD